MALATLIDSYVTEVTPKKGESKRQHDVRAAEMFKRFFGKSRTRFELARRD